MTPRDRSLDPPATIRLLAVWPEALVEKLELAGSEQIVALRLIISEATPETFRHRLKVGRHHLLVTPESVLGAGSLTGLSSEQLSLAIITPLPAEEEVKRRDWPDLAPAVLVMPPDIDTNKLVAFVHEVCRLLGAGYRLLTVIRNAWERTDPSPGRPFLYVPEVAEAVWPLPVQRLAEALRRPETIPQTPPLTGMPFIIIRNANIVEGDQIYTDRSTRVT